MTRGQPDWAGTRRLVLTAMIDRLLEFVAADPATRSLEAGDDDVVVRHAAGTWSWQVAKHMAIPLEIDTPSIPWQVEIWVRERRSRPGSRLRGLHAFSVPHSRRVGAIHHADDPVAGTRSLVERELQRQAVR